MTTSYVKTHTVDELAYLNHLAATAFGDEQILAALEQHLQDHPLPEASTEVTRWECTGLIRCDALLEEPGICQNCQDLANDAAADAALDAWCG